MKDYVVQAGPLRTFDSLFDPRLEKFRAVADYHAIEITARPGTQRIYMHELRRSSDQEITFILAFFSAVAKGHRTVFGLRDVTRGRAYELGDRLKKQDRLKWMDGEYGSSEDELVIVELQDFKGDFALLKGCVPPTSGELFCYLTAAPFDVFDIYWKRSCQASLKAREDRFRKDVAALANQSRIALHQDPGGSYTVILHPSIPDVSEIENQITAAGEKAGMSITFAPGLFG